tara:strand:+ start:3391 stop:4458 length:1068 start_codon:yes stop_codon:yes gene_type:complete
MQSKKTFTYVEGINQALTESMKIDKNMICYGLGIDDPKNIFGTTVGLKKKFGPKRVFDVPCSENALTGISIGASLNGVRSVVTHQRLDFFLLAMDQLVNSAAKWHYMFGSRKSVPITIRLIIGRGWGQGPTHSQNLQAWFNHIPGLKVVAPTFAEDARDVLFASIFDPNPVIFLEHRWLHQTVSNKVNLKKNYQLGKAKISRRGKDLTLISFSFMTLESISAAKFLKENYNIDCEIIDLRSIKPLDEKMINKSINKTKNVIVLDTGHENGSFSGELISRITQKFYGKLKNPPIRMAMPNTPEPTSFGLTKKYYLNSQDIVLRVLKFFNVKKNQYKISLKKPYFHDQPGEWFKGPF